MAIPLQTSVHEGACVDYKKAAFPNISSKIHDRGRDTMCELLPVAKLHNLIMTKVGVEPIYEIVVNDYRLHKEKYMMQVTCQLSLNDEPVSALGHYGPSKEIAKEKAAVAFMEKFFVDYENTKVNRFHLRTPEPVCRMLERHCLKNNLGEPQYHKTIKKENISDQSYIVKCTVSESTTKSRSQRLNDAVLTAAMKMLQILTKTRASDENSTPRRNSVDEHNVTSTPAETLKVPRNPQLHKFMNDNKKYKQVREA